jgi:hypothetical protein
MGEKIDLEKISAEITDIILRQPIESQNEIFAMVRRNLINARKEHIAVEMTSINDHQARTDFASKTLESVLMSSFEQPKCTVR